jgi:hypothetical protein
MPPADPGEARVVSSPAEPAPWLLVVTVGIDYVAPARMPRDLQRAGFKVALLAPESSLAAHTAFVDRVAYFPEATNLLEWIRALAAAIRAVDPLLILPGDDIALRTMMQLVLDPPAGIDPAMQSELETVAAGRSVIPSAGSIRSTRRACSSWRSDKACPSRRGRSRQARTRRSPLRRAQAIR